MQVLSAPGERLLKRKCKPNLSGGELRTSCTKPERVGSPPARAPPRHTLGGSVQACEPTGVTSGGKYGCDSQATQSIRLRPPSFPSAPPTLLETPGRHWTRLQELRLTRAGTETPVVLRGHFRARRAAGASCHVARPEPPDPETGGPVPNHAVPARARPQDPPRPSCQVQGRAHENAAGSRPCGALRVDRALQAVPGDRARSQVCVKGRRLRRPLWEVSGREDGCRLAARPHPG